MASSGRELDEIGLCAGTTEPTRTAQGGVTERRVRYTEEFLDYDEATGDFRVRLPTGTVVYSDHFYQRGAVLLPEAVYSRSDSLTGASSSVSISSTTASSTLTLHPSGGSDLNSFGRAYALLPQKKKRTQGNSMFVVGLVPQTLWTSAFHGRDDFQYSSRCFLIGFDLDYTRTKWRAYIVHPHSIDEHIRDVAKPSPGDLVADEDSKNEVDDDVAKLISSSTSSSSRDSWECQEEDSPWHGEDDEWWTTDTSKISWGAENSGAGAGTEKWFACTSTTDASSDKSARRKWWEDKDKHDKRDDLQSISGTGPVSEGRIYHPFYENQDVASACWLPAVAAKDQVVGPLNVRAAVTYVDEASSMGASRFTSASFSDVGDHGRGFQEEAASGSTGGSGRTPLEVKCSNNFSVAARFDRTKFLQCHKSVLREAAAKELSSSSRDENKLCDERLFAFLESDTEDAGASFDEKADKFGKKLRKIRRLLKEHNAAARTSAGNDNRRGEQIGEICLQINERFEAVFDLDRLRAGKSADVAENGNMDAAALLEDYRWVVLTPSCPTQFRVEVSAGTA